MSEPSGENEPPPTVTSGRARRSAAKRIDYSKEQQFSDGEDVFEDIEEEEKQPIRASTGRKPRSNVARQPRKPRSSASRGIDQNAGATAQQTAYSLYGSSTITDPDDFIEMPSRVVFTEKGYDPSLPPIRERFPFLPEYEEDGSPKIELIVGRRCVDEDELLEDDEDEATDSPIRLRSVKKNTVNEVESIEYEYLVKHKGRSYLHLEWKKGADLESMNKSAKGIYRRYLKKIAIGDSEDLENPEFDPSFIVPEKIIDSAEQEITVELTDKELLRWEKQREKELAEDDESEDEEELETVPPKVSAPPHFVEKDASKTKQISDDEKESSKDVEYWSDMEEIDFVNFPMDRLRAVANRETYYAVIAGSDNPYRDGYIKEPPKKPRPSYLFFQACMRPYYLKHNPKAPQAEIMTIMSDTWKNFSDAEKEPFIQLAREETALYEKERALMEKAQRPNEVWQPLRRCLMVLNRLASDSFSEIFLEPVDLREFPDYEEIIDSPIDLSTIRKNLLIKKYQVPEQFARDCRKVWNNCKIYNQHGTAIWHVADYMSKLFERLYHAWVLEFRERYLRWADPRARPWERTCRITEGKCGSPDDQIVVCDHCDAMYGIKNLSPPLKKVPKHAWLCPDCKPKLKSIKGVRMLSATAENAARKRAELGDVPKKIAKQMMYLVKWAGLGYEFCTWETKTDVNDNLLISRYYCSSDTLPEEADMSEEVIDQFLESSSHINETNAGGVACIPSLRTQLYAQTRAFHFVKFGLNLPNRVSIQCGPCSTAAYDSVTAIHNSSAGASNRIRDVVECLNDLLLRVVRGDQPSLSLSKSLLPSSLAGEYDAVIPITAKGLMLNVGETQGAVSFLGYRTFEDGSKGPSEIRNLIRNTGDKIIAVDGVSTVKKTFKNVISMLRESGKKKYCYLRLLGNGSSDYELSLTSAGSIGRYTIETLRKKLRSDRQRAMVNRKKELNSKSENSDIGDNSESAKNGDSDDESDDSGGEFQPESDDDEIAATSDTSKAHNDSSTGPALDTIESKCKEASAEPVIEVQGMADEAARIDTESIENPAGDNWSFAVVNRQETTRSLAFRLLQSDVDYSSDEGGDENSVYYMDGVDSTFTRLQDVVVDQPLTKISKTESDVDTSVIPARQSEFASLGVRSKLAAAVVLSVNPPDVDDFDCFPFPSTKELKTQEQEQRRLQMAHSPTKASRSTVKVNQVSMATGEILHVWANVEAAAATLQLPLNELRQVLRGEYDEEIGDEVGGYKWEYALAGAKVTAGAGTAGRGGGGKKAKEAWLEFRDKLYDPAEPHIYKNSNRLRDYQVDGVNWLASTWYKRQGCILADEMGLGKTVQIVCYIEHLFRVEKIRRPFLVVVPLSTVEHWRREFEGWTDLSCCIYHDRQRIWRDVLREYEWYFKDRPHTPEHLRFDVLVTTYDTLIGDFDVISQIPFRVAVVDEAHRLRNQKGKLLECMREIAAKGTMQYGFQSRVLMSGTPLQNDLTELWALLNFIEPFKFPELDDFLAKFGNMANKDQVEALQRMISPYMLRRVKEDVAKDIPAKEETVIDVELTGIQKQYYRAIFEHNHAFLNMGSGRQSAPKLMNIQMELRKVCNHPFLLEGVEHRETERLYKEFQESGKLDNKSPEEQQQLLNGYGYIMTSGKMVLLDKLLPKLHQEGHKVLIFSQMVKMLDLISEYCEFRSYPYERLDGRIRGTERQKAIDRFEREPSSFVFLLSTRAGGVGINLTAADICILFDSDWNPQNDVQAQARCHRIGQTKDVRIYRLVTSRSFEQEMFDRASRKLGLEQAVLGTFEKEREDDKPSHEEMEQLLKKGAYALLEDDNDAVTQAFCADDIDSILAKRTRTRVVEGAKTSSWLNKQGMVVSKSKFTTEEGEQLDMDDPLFWQKVMPDFVTPSILLQKLQELFDDIEGKKRGPGRGRWREKKKLEATRKCGPDDRTDTSNLEMKNEREEMEGMEVAKDDGNGDEDEELNGQAADENSEHLSDDDDDTKNGTNTTLSRTYVRKVAKFITELKTLMQSVFDEDDDDALAQGEREQCQQLLLTVSVKGKVFNEEQRYLARSYLKRLEGDRRRRCRTIDQQTRFQPGVHDDQPINSIPEVLMIRSRKKRKKPKASVEDDDEEEVQGEPEPDEPALKRVKWVTEHENSYVGEDGYLHHSDSEADWSNVAEDLYQSSAQRRDRISRKEASRRRSWAVDDDAATAAGRPWPTFPRHVVREVLDTVLGEAVKYDEANGGIFSVPVPREDFPQYYEQIQKPMDYSTMKSKLENGEYRSALAMQKDFVLILQNCRDFNDPSSDIVKEARRQHLRHPKVLKEAALKHNLFLAEDGTVLEMFDEEKSTAIKKERKTEGNPSKDSKSSKKKTFKKSINSKADADAGVDIGTPPIIAKKTKGKVKKTPIGVRTDREETEKPRIKIKISSTGAQVNLPSPKSSKRLVENNSAENGNNSAENGNDVVNANDTTESTSRKKRLKKDLLPSTTPTAKITNGSRRKNDIDDTEGNVVDEGDGGSVSRQTRTTKHTPSSSVSASRKTSRNGIDESESRTARPSRSKGKPKTTEEIPDSVWIDVTVWKLDRDAFNGTYESARALFTKYGPWKLVSGLEDRFSEIATATLQKMCSKDRYKLFLTAVSLSEFHDYRQIVDRPMDFGRMKEKIEKGLYGIGSAAASAFYYDFLLVFDNCRLYNSDESEVTEEAARILSLAPESYVSSCFAALKKTKL